MVYLDVRSFVWYNKCQKTNALIQLANRNTHHLHFQMIKHTGGPPMFLKKTPKAKGTYLAITESYYDK